MQHGSTSLVKYASVTQPDPLVVVPIAERKSPIASHSKMTNKRTFSNAMETEEEEESSQFLKKQKIEEEGQMVKVTNTKGKKK